MNRLLVAGGLLLAACGARTELDPFSSDGAVSDAGVDAVMPSVDASTPGMTIGLFRGDTSNDGASWSRPFTCGDSGFGGAYPYSVVTFENPTSANIRVEVLVDWSFDGFLHVYQSPFDPEQTGARCLAANDDYGSTRQSQVDGIIVPAGGAIDLVLSSYLEDTSGSYEAFVITQ